MRLIAAGLSVPRSISRNQQSSNSPLAVTTYRSGLTNSAAPPGPGVAAPAGWLDLDLNELELALARGSDELDVRLGDRERVIEEERRRLGEAAAPVGDQAAADRPERVDVRGRPGPDPADPPLQPGEQPLSGQTSKDPPADTGASLSG